ncbi:ABC transporter permease [Peribacillus alkalitolerans]|uniref:ABC transporter permease n=1 Tax=Peribacillus alkalitolerans TaxID=1550385 RepID=UPI0013D11ED9|nr:ABC transporter permease [Peribacillus alkalitolerans]
MLKLIQNEWMKIWRRPGTYVMVGILLLFIMLMSGFIKYQILKDEKNPDVDWKQTLQQETANLKTQYSEVQGVKNSHSEYLKKQIAINEYRIENNMNPNGSYSVWGFIQDNVDNIGVVGVFTIIIAAGIVASEFSWGTIKLLLIRPIKRTKILLSKYITTLLFGLFLIVILFTFSGIVGLILFGTPDENTPHLLYSDGKVKEQSMLIYLAISYSLKSITTLILVTMAFMVSAVFRNSSLAIGISLILMFMGTQLTMILASKFEWAKYIVFANTDFMQYIDGTPMVEGMTATFSTVMILLYLALFLILAFTVFKKRDVAA